MYFTVSSEHCFCKTVSFFVPIYDKILDNFYKK